MSEFRFLYPVVFWVLIPAIMWGVWRSRLWTPSVMQYSDTRVFSGLTATTRLRLRQLPNALRWVAWGCILMALARPQISETNIRLEANGIDIVFALDISDSMGTGDLEGVSRLDASKFAITNFVQGRSSDRIGLVVFAEQAYYQAPPTLNYTVFLEILDGVTYATQLGLSNKSALGMGLATAANMLSTSDATTKIIILITDGANNAGTIDPITATKASKALGIRVYSVGIGSAGQGSDLDEIGLQRIATLADGRYFNATQLSALEEIYREIDRLEKTQQQRDLALQWGDIAPAFLAVALILLLLERILRLTIFQTIP